jgi:hypothetical protein
VRNGQDAVVRQKRHHGWPFRLAEDVPPGRLSGHRVRIASWSDFEAIVFLGCPQRMYAVLGEHQPLLQQADQVGQFNGPAVRGLGGRQFALGDPAADGAVGRPPRSVTMPTTGWTWPAGYPDMAGTGPSEGDTTPAQREAPPPKERRPIRCRFVWASALGRVGRDRVLHRCSATGAVRSAAQLAHGCAKTHSSRRGFHRSDRVECSWHLLVTPYPLHGSGAGSRRRGTTIQRQIQRASRVWCCRRSTRRRRSLASPAADARLAEHRTVP